MEWYNGSWDVRKIVLQDCIEKNIAEKKFIHVDYIYIGIESCWLFCCCSELLIKYITYIIKMTRC